MPFSVKFAVENNECVPTL